jgi:tetratricopeptide (TPR) repeat protein
LAEVHAELVLAAAHELILSGRWELADQLLAAAQTGNQAEQAALALARARVAVELRQWRGTGDPAGPVAAAADRIAALPDAAVAFDLELLRLFGDYWAELSSGDGMPRLGPDGRDAGVLAELRDRSRRLAATAPDPRRAARAAFYAGLVADNLCGEPDRARELFTAALAYCRPEADDDFAAEALRHLGGCALAAGDLALARQRWERSAELAQRAGWLPLALAQQALLAELAVREGDRAAAMMLGGEVRRWAAALGLGRLATQAAAVGQASMVPCSGTVHPPK